MQPLIFFGTPEFAVPTLAALAATEFRPALVVSQPSRPAGRGWQLTEPPVVRAARELGIEFLQVEKVRDGSFLERLRLLEPAIAVVVAFGQIFPAELLAIPRLGCLNVHASLLPRWRGAAPIQAAIRAGDSETGVTTMVMEAGLDSGPVLLERATTIGASESSVELSARLAEIGGELMLETLRDLERGAIVPQAQPDEGVTLAPKVTRRDGQLRWDLAAVEIERAVRAYRPWPGVELPIAVTSGAGTVAEGSFKVLDVRITEGHCAPWAGPGTVAAVTRDELVVDAGEGTSLAILRAQLPGRGPVTGGELARSLGLRPGGRVG
ncbi:MAG: methionyl-tRNA formyltransferase [Thermoanaerobaculia bacterium]